MVTKSKPIAVIRKRKLRRTRAKRNRAEPTTAVEGDQAEELPEEDVVADEESGEEASEAEESNDPHSEDGSPVRFGKHIHPCVCDLPLATRKRIAEHNKRIREKQTKFDRRIQEIQEELARLEEERLEKERELQEQDELFGDEYELVGKKKKRKKRAARRASMVSLGVKQIISWKKPPKVPIKFNLTWNLRRSYSAYCGKRLYPPSPLMVVDFKMEPAIRVRDTTSFRMRSKINSEKKTDLIRRDDKRPRFVTSYFT